MKLLKADHNRRLEIPGVPGLVQRPVDIDQSQTGFDNLRTLRVYSFEPGAAINGHAEEDEVLIVLLAGSAELTVTEANAELGPVMLTGANSERISTCAAYLPPHAAYRLVPQTAADVAYVRATPINSRTPKLFTQANGPHADGVTVLLDETTYAERLRIRLVQLDAQEQDIAFVPLGDAEAASEALVHLRISPERKTVRLTADDAEIELSSWDSASMSPGERSSLHVAAGSSALALIVFAD
jgi:KduI/IolB family